jgi:hypothetical protein
MKTKTILFTILGSFVFLLQMMATNNPMPQSTTQNSDSSNSIFTGKTQPDSSLIKIAQHSEVTAKNTQPTQLTQTDADEWWIIVLTVSSLLVAIAAAYWAWISAKATRKTVSAVEKGTEKRQINRIFQEKIFIDLIRHLYRNKVCVCATRLKLEQKTNGYENFYPSEEHLLKLRVLPEDLRLDRFDNTPDYYDTLHKMELYFRNFNIEVEVALEHLKTKTLSKEIKKRDLNVLELKSGFLTQEIYILMKAMEFDISIDKIKELLIKESGDKRKNNQENLPVIKIPARINENKNITYYDDAPLQLTEVLNEDIRGEYPKISLIAFPKTASKTKI